MYRVEKDFKIKGKGKKKLCRALSFFLTHDKLISLSCVRKKAHNKVFLYNDTSPIQGCEREGEKLFPDVSVRNVVPTLTSSKR
jgi:hypothetical protein